MTNQYVFEPEFCIPASAWEKEQVEKNFQARGQAVICLAHVTNQMGTIKGDFETGEANGIADALAVVSRSPINLAYPALCRGNRIAALPISRIADLSSRPQAR